ncbi:MAG: N-acyl-D-amino-acid deacylase family protein [Thermoanaerobaculia bacterium]
MTFPPVRRRLLRLSCLALLAACATAPRRGAPPLDLKIAGGRVVDGTGAPWFRADVGVRGDTIVAVGDLARVPAAVTLDAAGQAVSPGFIDLLGWSHQAALIDPHLEGKVRQGVTTEATGEGFSPGPLSAEQAKEQAATRPDGLTWRTLGDFMRLLERRGTALNFAFFVGASNPRAMVLGLADRDPDEREMAAMEAIVEQAMRDGALGLSTSLIYVPAVFAETPELVRLARVASRHGGVYFTHLRDEADKIGEALDEAFQIGREAAIPVNVWHLKVSGKQNWGRMPEVVARIEAARREGLDVAANVYPYTASSTSLSALVPVWALEGGYKVFRERLRDPAQRARIAAEIPTSNFYTRVSGPEGVLVTSVPAPEFEQHKGKRLTAVAAAMAVDPIEALLRLYEASPHSPGAIYFSMREDDLRTALRQPWVSVGADSSAVVGEARNEPAHPRAYGTFPRLLGHYAREEGLFSLEEAVRRVTSQAASRLKLWDRGVVRPGMKADLVVFDPAAIHDLSTYEDPHQLSVGVTHVVVNGVPVLRDGGMTAALPGRVLRRQGSR